MLINAAPPQPQHFYLPIERVDRANRTVTARFFTSGRVRGDKYNLKYETIKRAGERYMKAPCIREMHQPSAAGKALTLHFDDETQTGTMTLKVVDDQAWNKVEEEVYRGLSVGGIPLILRGSDVEEFDWIETSLVDRPKDPGALFLAISRAEEGDVFAYGPAIELEEDATEEQLALARVEMQDQLERFEEVVIEEDLARFDHNQPRDDHGMWTIIGGERVSIHGHDIDHSHIDEAKTRFGLSDEAHSALKKAHDEGRIKTDDHLYRTIAHAQAASGSHPQSGAGALHAVTSSHIHEGLGVHGHSGAWESRWASHAFDQAPKLKNGVSVSHAVGLHELQKGDVVHSPSDGKSSTISGKVTKVLKNHVDFEYGLPGGATHGMRVKKSDLARPGFVRRPGDDGHTLHHIEVARAEIVELKRAELEEELQYQAEAIVAVARRANEEDQQEAVSQCMERLLDILHGEADSAIERGGEGRNSWRTQPRDDHGMWTDGAGRLRYDHVHHVMHHEGITEKDHHDHVRDLIEKGQLRTREDVLKHLDSIHETRKKAEDKNDDAQAKGKPRDVDVLAAADKHGLDDSAARVALLEAHSAGHIKTHAQLHAIIQGAVKSHKADGGEVQDHVASAVKEHGSNGKSNAKSPSSDAKPDKTGKEEPAPESEAAPQGWKAHLKKFGKDALHAFLQGVSKGKAAGAALVGRAEDGAGEGESAGPDFAAMQEHLVERFFDALEKADPKVIAAALSAALDVLDGETSDEEVERLLSSGDVPVRENLEGGDKKSHLDHLRSMFFESDWDGNREELIAALKAALLEINRGEGVVSFAAKPEALQRLEEVQGSMSRLESDLSIARSEAQAAGEQREAAIGRAEIAEENVTRLESTNTQLTTDIQRLRAMESSTPPVQYTAVPLGREFPANNLLNPISDAKKQVEELKQEHQDLQRALLTETNQAKREKGSERLMVIESEIALLSRIA